ncbi:GNAT family N-acetyltransferase/peptidase C39 family protein [Oceanimonas sp. MB9]|uniref:GNAT family N-acetyltransferase/peptidase C39 family protein n=1 Tax=Oceanimonas sp. MB9 TaxID=2588453 RepID=UPI0013F5C699|nr:GNAT family N-acetyltransferase/peptidase C39 family protein [Oceanimonas sp. MB9]NHI01748.1 Ribosomal-protein-alanine acetyltransferase [Oceanimonas sp. MB9]
MSAPVVRPALRSDLDVLLALEHRCFDQDRISRRSFLRFTEHPQDVLLVAEQNDALLGYVLVLFRRNTQLARIYSIAISPDSRGLGLGRTLLEQAEASARQQGAVFMRLEVRTDNIAAQNLYQQQGYRQFGIYHDYYEDHESALRYQKRIHHYHPLAGSRTVPYYRQTTEFTCGPASLMMALSALDATHHTQPDEELQLWREATTIFMTQGHGGCGPHGLALAAHRRGFAVELVLNQDGPLFINSVRSPDKKVVLERVHRQFLANLAQAGIVPRHEHFTLEQLEQGLSQGRLPLVLISTYHLDGRKAPHWVLVCAMDREFVYIHDPDIDEATGESPVDKQYLPIARSRFDRLARYGQHGLRTLVWVAKP